MNLDELKKSMSTLDDVLAEKSGENINFNSAACNSAQKKIMRTYRQGALSTLILGVVFPCAWQSGFGNDAFTPGIKIYLVVFLLIATLWYGYLYIKTKKINIAVNTPAQTMKQVASLRFCALTGEIVLGMAIAVMFTLFLSNLWIVGQYRFWIVLSAIVVFVILLVTVYLPRSIRDFKNLTAME